jgi:GNAT superfamily N-acetyltransferase
VDDLVVRLAQACDLAGLPALEHAADAVFEQVGVWSLPQPADDASAQALADAAAVLVAGRPPVGFARLELIDAGAAGPLAHLEQLSVDPAFARQGIGTALVRGCCEWAARAGCAAVTLTTFAQVPFNAPFYARLGFTVIDEVDMPAALREMRRREARMGLDALGVRVAMRRAVGTT